MKSKCCQTLNVRAKAHAAALKITILKCLTVLLGFTCQSNFHSHDCPSIENLLSHQWQFLKKVFIVLKIIFIFEYQKLNPDCKVL